MTEEQFNKLQELILSMQKKDSMSTIIKTLISTLLPILVSSAFWIIIFSTKVKEDIKYLNGTVLQLQQEYKEIVTRKDFDKVLKNIDHNFKTVSDPQDKIISIYDTNK